jgi:hypothetical protein
MKPRTVYEKAVQDFTEAAQQLARLNQRLREASLAEFKMLLGFDDVVATARRLRLAADASAILLAGLKALAWYFLSPDMFRSETTRIVTCFSLLKYLC